MSATYDATLPTAKDRIRHALGDTDVTDNGANALRSDEMIAAIVAANGEATALAILAEGLVTEYAQVPDAITTGGTSLRWSERVKAWRELAARVRLAIAATNASAAGGFASVAPTTGEAVLSEYERPGDWPYWGRA